MTKTISIYAAQIVLGVIALASGYAKVTGNGMMVESFHALGIGSGFLLVAGAAELVAGLCLMLPRGGILGAVLLTGVMVGALGVTIGHVASAATAPAQAANYTVSSFQAKPGSHDSGMLRTIQRKTEWSI
jgi:uncharacterized membrane protein YphA (DoxX/SURF4 family)